MKIKNNSLTDALYNLDPKSGSGPEYARGILVGAMAALSALADGGEWPYAEALKVLKPLLPDKIMPEAIPVSWADDFTSGEPVTGHKYEVRLHIGNNATNAHVAAALWRDEPDAAKAIMCLNGNDDVLLIVEHDYSQMVGKQSAEYAVCDLVYLLEKNKPLDKWIEDGSHLVEDTDEA